jgi:trimethylamine--corrinoid protein Co-methyltransferase
MSFDTWAPRSAHRPRLFSSLLGRRSTRTLSRAGELWRPSLFRRGPWEEFAARPLAADAAQRARELIASHEVPPLADDVEAEIAQVIASYRHAAQS